MIKVTATVKISWNFPDVDLPDDMPTDEMKEKFTKGLEEKMKDSLEAEETSIETLEIQQGK